MCSIANVMNQIAAQLLQQLSRYHFSGLAPLHPDEAANVGRMSNFKTCNMLFDSYLLTCFCSMSTVG